MEHLFGTSSLWVIAIALAAAFLAGLVDAISGGGGLVQLPVLLFAFPNAPLAHLLGTNKFSAVFGTSLAARTYAKKVGLVKEVAIPFGLAAVTFSFVGAMLTSLISRDLLEPIVVVILIAVALFVLFKPELGTQDLPLNTSVKKSLLLGTGLGFYDGLIGPGTGTFLLFSLVLFMGFQFLSASATAKLINVLTNTGSLIFFLPSGHIYLGLGACMAAANSCGAYVGAKNAIARGNQFVRVVFLIVIVALIIKFITRVI